MCHQHFLQEPEYLQPAEHPVLGLSLQLCCLANFTVNRHKIICNIFRMQDLQARLISAGFSEVAFRIINSKLAINETEGFSMLKNMAGGIPVLQEPNSIVSSTWQSILEAGIDHILVLDR
jgi:hypothetical protein